MKKTKKALATLAIAGMTLSMIPFNAFAASTVPTRIMGMTAEQTATKIADQTGYTGTAILASSTSYGMVDALTAGPLAASLKAPILLTGAGNTLNADTKAELTKLAVKKVYVTSGTAVIKQGVIDELKAMGIEVIALGGFDRAETSVNIAKQMTGVTKVAVANGVPDALSIASVASAANQPILLTNKNALPSSVADYLASAGVTSTDVIGGTGVISDAVVAGLPGATRHFGMTAYDTNNQVIQDFASSLEFNNIYVANGQTGIDALAGAPLAAQTKSAIVLTDGKTVPAVAAFTHSKNASAVVTALGGTAVVPESVRMGVAAGNVSTPVGDLAIVAVSSLTDDGHVLSVEFNKAMAPVDKSMVSIFESGSLARVGVESVKFAANGLSAEIVLYDNTSNGAPDEIVRLKNYKITIGSLSFEFARPGYADSDDGAYVSAVDADKREITVPLTDVGVLEVPESMNVDFQKLLGQEIRVWWNADKVVTNYEIQSEAFYDAIEFDGDEIKTLDEKVKYDLATEVEVIVNYGAADEAVVSGVDDAKAELDNLKFDYAKVILNNDGDVKRIYAYNFDPTPFIVETVDEDYIVDYNGDELDLEKYIIVKDGMQIAIDDIKEGDLVFFNEDANDGDGFAVVYNKTVSGEIDAVFTDSFDLDGKNYAFVVGAKYLNEDNEKATLNAAGAEKLQDGGTVTAYFNHRGQVILVKGVEGVLEQDYATNYTTDSFIAYEDVRGNQRVELTVVDQDGVENVYDFDINDLDEIVVQTEDGDVEYEVNGDFPATAGTEIDGFVLADPTTATKLVAAGEEEAFRIFASSGSDALNVEVAGISNKNRMVGVARDDNGTITGLKFFEDSFGDLATPENEYEIDYDDKYVNGKRLQDSTIVIGVDTDNAIYPDADEVSFFTWKELKADKVDLVDPEVYFDEDDNVTHIVVADSLIAGDTREVNGLVTEVFIDSADNQITRLTALINGEKVTLSVDNLDDAQGLKTALETAHGVTVALEINNGNDEVTGIFAVGADDLDDLADNDESLNGYFVLDVNVSDRTVVLGATADTEIDAETGVKVVKLESDGYVYDATDSTPSNEALRDLVEGQKVNVVLVSSGSSFASLIVIIADAE